MSRVEFRNFKNLLNFFLFSDILEK